ncbi:lipopolysaccharide biosynthesis protein [Streptomyces sp. L2]|uniref:lipopolysaccharide biosynthesis protein n=1 Tax=Streptomyces sp. L2 TaxID=2162665 RepID=UPI0010121D90|nr:lipopolysaccharide biosynthesis protein [Streptomyces sp. L2]
MTAAADHTSRASGPDEPDLLRDQFKQLLRYRLLIVLGLVAGLAGGAWIGLAGGDSYVATSEVTVRSPTADPFGPGSTTQEKQVSIGSERQTAVSNAVASRAAKTLGMPDAAQRLQSGLQVTNPPNTLVLRFDYTAGSPGTAARRANAFAQAYLDNRQEQTQSLIGHMVAGYEKQLKPLEKQRDRLTKQIAVEGRSESSTQSAQTSVLSQISQLDNSITQLKALDTTPGFVVRTATPPRAPSGPGLLLLLGLGAAVGIGVGLLAAWVRLVFDPTARSEGDVVRALRAPVLGTLPHARRSSGDANGLLARGRMAEAYRSVAFRLAYDQRFADRRRLLVVAPRGAITTAAAASVNLAASFAEMGHEVLLVEADLRSPGLAARLRKADGIQPGWAARIPARGDRGWPTGERIPMEAEESGTFGFIPGARVRNVARALTSAPATQLIATADGPDAVVVVLAPAVLSYADAIALADRVDGVLVVCDPRKVRRDELTRIHELVTGAGGRVLGALLHAEGTARSSSSRGTRAKRMSRLAPWKGDDGTAAPGMRSGAPEASMPRENTTPAVQATDDSPTMTLALRRVDRPDLPVRPARSLHP